MKQGMGQGSARACQKDQGWWEAVVARDTRFDGQFVYGVRSTGIYCQPSCPSRRPHRKNAVFFPLPASAERAGFRPCRRCHPQSPASRNAPAAQVRRICQIIDEQVNEPPTLKALSAAVGISPHHLQRTFRQVLGITPRQYADARRLSRVKQHLQEGQEVTQALYEAGYGSSSRLYERASSQLGMTPATYRQGGKGMRIDYTTTPCALGRLLVAATERGICAVSLGGTDAVLEKNLRREYPEAQVRRDRNRLSKWVRALLLYLDGQERQLDLPLDIRGTAFQRRVWEELRRIPYGDTRSYGEIARFLGQPEAARAVARACATNPVPLLIPCHRVVRGNGALGGYGLGIERKRALLAQEQEVAAASTRPARTKQYR